MNHYQIIEQNIDTEKNTLHYMSQQYIAVVSSAECGNQSKFTTDVNTMQCVDVFLYSVQQCVDLNALIRTNCRIVPRQPHTGEALIEQRSEQCAVECSEV